MLHGVSLILRCKGYVKLATSMCGKASGNGLRGDHFQRQ